MWGKALMLALAALLALLIARAPTAKAEDLWTFGFARREISPEATGGEALYIAGYNNGVEITEVLDACEARALYLEADGTRLLLIGIDAVALDSGTVAEIREGLNDLPGAPPVHVYATHTHAGPDTLGLWGPIGVNGKNRAYMQALVQAAVEAGREALGNRQTGEMRFGRSLTTNMYRDSRDPQVYDAYLYQLRLVPEDGAGVRMLFYGAHAESLRSQNTRLSRDYPGLLCDQVQAATGDNALFAPGAVGGLIMTKEFVSDMPAQAVKNLQITADRLTDYALSISPEQEEVIAPSLQLSNVQFSVPMDNPVFLAYKLLGALRHKTEPGESATSLHVVTELTALALGDLTIALVPGEIFPELVSGRAYGQANPQGVNPESLQAIAARHGREKLLIVGLADDELGYIVPPSDFLLNEAHPYIDRAPDATGEDHYEETNSVGPDCARCLAEAFERALQGLEAQE